MIRLDRTFFQQPTLEVAQNLLGKVMTFGEHQGIITETEAYIGKDDAACHAARGLTPRTKVLFGPAGHAYVYLIYGMYYCLNFVTEKEGFPAGVLIRGLKLTTPPFFHLDGPGKLCRFLGIDLTYNALDLITSEFFYLSDIQGPLLPFKITPRIGIKVATDKLWRFVVDKDA